MAQALPSSRQAQQPPQLTVFGLSPWPSKCLRAQAHRSHQSRAVKCPLRPQHGPNNVQKELEENPQHGCSQYAPSRSLHKVVPLPTSVDVQSASPAPCHGAGASSASGYRGVQVKMGRRGYPGRVPLGGWTRWPTEVPSNPKHPVILWLLAQKRIWGHAKGRGLLSVLQPAAFLLWGCSGLSSTWRMLLDTLQALCFSRAPRPKVKHHFFQDRCSVTMIRKVQWQPRWAQLHTGARWLGQLLTSGRCNVIRTRTHWPCTFCGFALLCKALQSATFYIRFTYAVTFVLAKPSSY